MSDDLVKRLRGIDRTDIYLYETMNDAADRIEELEAKLATCKKYRDAYDKMGRIGTEAYRELDDKFQKAVKSLNGLTREVSESGTWLARTEAFEIARAALAAMETRNG